MVSLGYMYIFLCESLHTYSFLTTCVSTSFKYSYPKRAIINPDATPKPVASTWFRGMALLKTAHTNTDPILNRVPPIMLK